jgi:hypothetical protein
MRVYLLGAGFNLAIGPTVGRKPFLANSFFRALLGDEVFRERVRQDAQDLTSYIESYWKLAFEDLANKEFDLEECYTLLELQRADLADINAGAGQQLEAIQEQLKRFAPSGDVIVAHHRLRPLCRRNE